MSDLSIIVELSHKFGTEEYVKGGGGNTSVKDENTLSVKPSGTCLRELTESSFVEMDRKKLARLYEIETPKQPSQRESLVKDVMAEAVISDKNARASVEAPLHNSLKAKFVVHTHPAIVNGMLCGKEGEKFCREFFPEALWIDYIDPGYTLCMKVRELIKKYEDINGKEPEIIFLKNHGVFVSGNSSKEIELAYDNIFSTLNAFYDQKNLSSDLEICPLDTDRSEKVKKQILETSTKYGFDHITVSGGFDYTNGPLTPDHIVYAKSYYLCHEHTAEAFEGFKNKHGYFPHVVCFDNMVFGLGKTDNKASLALQFAIDAALVKKLTSAFGGVQYMSNQAREFIENWEVESYRQKQI